MAKPTPKGAAPKPAAKKSPTDAATGLPAPKVAQPLDARIRDRRDAIRRDVRGMPALQIVGAAVVEELALMHASAGEFPQELMEAALLLDRVAKSAAKLSEVIELAAAQHFRAKRPFERGHYAVTVELDKEGRKSPKWKEIAIVERTALCEKLGVPFVAAEYEKQVLARTEASKKDAVTIVETA